MVRVGKGDREGVLKNRSGILKGHTMLLEVRNRLARVPFKNHSNKFNGDCSP